MNIPIASTSLKGGQVSIETSRMHLAKIQPSAHPPALLGMPPPLNPHLVDSLLLGNHLLLANHLLSANHLPSDSHQP